MIHAYMLLTLRPGKSEEIITQISKVESVEKIAVVAGEFDAVVRVMVETLEDLLKVTDKIQLIEGVKKTTTQVIEKEIAL